MEVGNGTVIVSHPETGLEKRVPAGEVPTYTARGWSERSSFERPRAEVPPAGGGPPLPPRDPNWGSRPENDGEPSDPVDAPPGGYAPAGSVAPPKLIPIRVDVDARGTSIEVAGQEIAPYVGAYALEAQAGRPPMLTLYGVPDGVINVDGVVVAVRDREEREALAAFLDWIDPGELERLVLEDPELDNTPHATMRAALRVLRRLATG